MLRRDRTNLICALEIKRYKYKWTDDRRKGIGKRQNSNIKNQIVYIPMTIKSSTSASFAWCRSLLRRATTTCICACVCVWSLVSRVVFVIRSIQTYTHTHRVRALLTSVHRHMCARIKHTIRGVHCSRQNELATSVLFPARRMEPIDVIDTN